ncbi:hypothetical protein [Serratia rubidaea]|uniref:hypothetical protein n=1 Tax=Serratia rubidaea TaxID=61652 RepID=UPI000F832A9D|nr:hypothetical protein [Serratia rubidaea]MEB7586615.1 hypothetical protein [Serratia rubidaea]
MKKKLSGIKLVIYLIVTFFIFSVATFFCIRLGVAILFWLKTERFYFLWVDNALDSLKRGGAISIPLGIGIWFMSWMKARKEKQSPPKPEE